MKEITLTPDTDLHAVGDELVYHSYAHNRRTAPRHSPESYKRCGFAGDVDAMEARYQAELKGR